jgi:hypothetical protein
VNESGKIITVCEEKINQSITSSRLLTANLDKVAMLCEEVILIALSCVRLMRSDSALNPSEIKFGLREQHCNQYHKQKMTLSF